LFLQYYVADTSMNGAKTPATRGKLQLAPTHNAYYFSEQDIRLD